MSTAPVGGNFTLTSHNGNRVTPESFGNRYSLVFFGFTHCKVVCPETLAKLSRAIALSGINQDALQPLYITVDRERDTPERMKSFLQKDYPLFLGLTGSREEIDHAKAMFKVYAARRNNPHDPENYEVPHSAYSFLMSPDGACAAYFTRVDTEVGIADVLRATITPR